MPTKAKWFLTVMALGIAITMLTPTIFADTEIICPVVKIFCDGAETTANPAKVRAVQGVVKFQLDGSCETVTIDGDAPIGLFTLVDPGDLSKTVHFPGPGTYTYTTDGHKSATGGPYTIVVPEGVPSLSPFGIGMLIILLLGVTTWVLWRRRAGVTA